MATLQETIGSRYPIDGPLRERAGREYDAMTPQQQRAAYVHQARVIHEISYMLQLASEGHTTFLSDKVLLKHIEALAWSTDGTSAAPPRQGDPATDAMRSGYIKWLTIASDEEIQRFNQSIQDSLAEDDTDPLFTPSA